MDVVTALARSTRPLRRRVAPLQFKETHVNGALRGRVEACYVEIGVRTGESFRRATAFRKVGIDPHRHRALARLHPGEELFEMTSDEFFADHAAQVLGGRTVDVALIDGLHAYDQALRDFLNLERYMRPDGVIFLDDCNPATRARAEVRAGGAWNGDVWRVAALLAEVRTDLRYVTLDCDQGLGMATGFAPDAPPALSPADVARFGSLDYEALAVDRATMLRLRPARSVPPPRLSN